MILFTAEFKANIHNLCLSLFFFFVFLPDWTVSTIQCRLNPGNLDPIDQHRVRVMSHGALKHVVMDSWTMDIGHSHSRIAIQS